MTLKIRWGDKIMKDKIERDQQMEICIQVTVLLNKKLEYKKKG
jgi:hypothetical protein